MTVTMKISGSGSVTKNFTDQATFGAFMADIMKELHDKGLDLTLEIDYQGDADVSSECGTLYVNGTEVVDQLRFPL